VRIKKPVDILKYLKNNKWYFFWLGIVIFLVYVNILDNAFVADDIAVILKNKEWARGGGFLNQFRYNTFLKDFIYFIFGPSKFAYHLASIGFHVVCSGLVFFFLAIITKRELLAKYSTFLFALHPVHTEAVAWISASQYLVYSSLFLLAFLFFHFYLQQKKNYFLVGAFFFYLTSVLVSVWALPLVFVFPLYEVYLRKRSPSWNFYISLSILLVFYIFLIRGNMTNRLSTLASESKIPWRNSLLTIPHSVTQYLKLLFWPLDLSLYHEGGVLTQPYIWFARLVSFVFLVVLPFMFRKDKLFVFFFLFFLLALSLSLSPVQIASYVAERYLYLASISFCVFLAWLFFWVAKKINWQDLGLFLILVVSAFYAVRTFVRNNEWQSRASLWMATARTNPRSARVHNNLGDVYGGRGDIEKSIREFELARELKPAYADATHNLALAYVKKGDLEKAEGYFKEALEYNSSLYQSYYMLGAIEYERGDKADAKKYFQKALGVNPDYGPARKALQAIQTNPKGL